MLEEEKLGGTEEDSPELAGSEGAASKQLPGKPPVTALSKEEVELKKLVAEAEVAELKRDHLRYETDHPHVTFFRTWGPLGSAAIGFFGLMLVTAITQVSSCQSRIRLRAGQSSSADHASCRMGGVTAGIERNHRQIATRQPHVHNDSGRARDDQQAIEPSPPAAGFGGNR